VRTGESLRYETREFLAFYKSALERIIEINRAGIDFVEVYAQILLTKILTPFATGYVDLQSPTGAGLGAVAYNYDGEVYASDEARMLGEMGDKSFRLGNVHTSSYEEIFGLCFCSLLWSRSCFPSPDSGRYRWAPADERFLHEEHGDHSSSL
jgi:hypothetical protein